MSSQKRRQDRGIAQLVEQRSPKPRAEGSSPSAPAKKETVTVLVTVSFLLDKNCPRHARAGLRRRALPVADAARRGWRSGQNMA